MQQSNFKAKVQISHHIISKWRLSPLFSEGFDRVSKDEVLATVIFYGILNEASAMKNYRLVQSVATTL